MILIYRCVGENLLIRVVFKIWFLAFLLSDLSNYYSHLIFLHQTIILCVNQRVRTAPVDLSPVRGSHLQAAERSRYNGKRGAIASLFHKSFENYSVESLSAFVVIGWSPAPPLPPPP